jgi:hypothetical protein
MADSICYNITSEKYMTCEVTFCSDYKPENVYNRFYKNVVFVPEKVNYNGKEYTVTAVGNDAFCRSDLLLSVVLPNTIVSIGHGAFSSCPNFKSFTLPASVRVFDSWAFSLMPSLEYLAVEPGNELYDSREGCNAIIKTDSNVLVTGCRTTIIPDGVKVIANSAFISCFGHGGSNIEPVTMIVPKSVEVIEPQAFTFDRISDVAAEFIIRDQSCSVGICIQISVLCVHSVSGNIRAVGGFPEPGCRKHCEAEGHLHRAAAAV